MPKSFDRYVLQGWPEDRLPVCSSPICDREIQNGHPYAILHGTVKILCLSCAHDPLVRDATLGVLATETLVREREAKDRRRLQRTRNPRPATRVTQKARTVEVRPQKPPEQPKRVQTNEPYRPPFKYPPHPCRFCTREFQPRATNRLKNGTRVPEPQPYCSISCSVRGRRKNYRDRICPACDRVFYPRRGSHDRPQVCCSRSCARWWFPRGLRNPNPKPLVWSRSWGDGCRQCGRSDRRHKGQGYCPGCYIKHRIRGAPRGKETKLPDRTWRERMERRKMTDQKEQARAGERRENTPTSALDRDFSGGAESRLVSRSESLQADTSPKGKVSGETRIDDRTTLAPP